MGIWFNNVSKDLHLSSEVPPSDKKTKVAPLVLFYLSLVRRSSTVHVYVWPYTVRRSSTVHVYVWPYTCMRVPGTRTRVRTRTCIAIPRVYNSIAILVLGPGSYRDRYTCSVHVY